MNPTSFLCRGPSRREMLQIGALGLTGSVLPRLLAANEAGKRGRAKACIVIFLTGGPPQHETWDPKPDAPVEIRGPLGTIPSATPGLRVGELMPLTARLTQKIAVLRALVTGDNAHSSSGYQMLTGVPHVPMNSENAKPGAPNDYPVFGAIVQKLSGENRALPAAVTLPHRIANTDGSVWPGQDAGWLGRTLNPWLFTAVPDQADFRVPELTLAAELPPERVLERRRLLDRLAQRWDHLAKNDSFARLDRHSKQALDLLTSPTARRAFDLHRESDRVRQRYGLTPFGQSCLLARRLVEAGVRLVQVNWYRPPTDPDDSPVWDTHRNHEMHLKTRLMPPMDQAYSALLEDLDARGLLEETLVVWTGEFGRTPKINSNGGRDHWGLVFSSALAGGGVRGGIVYGSSDAQGGNPLDGIVEPRDLHATIYHCLGYDPDTEIRDPLDRPHPITRGRVLHPLLS